jgi:RNA-directed DNA polymerase
VALADEAPRLYRSFEQEVKGKRRLLVEATGPLKRLQRRILDNVLVRLRPSPVSFGGIKGRTIKDNATVHARSLYAAKMDIRDFYPSIHSTRVYEFFCKDQGCSPDVAHILTALTTRNYSLPLGTSTSPALADQIVRRIDVRISGLAARAGLKYTRYVDDITLSGPFPLQRLTGTAARILRQSGFKIKTSKLAFYGPDDNWVVTGAAIEAGRVTAPMDYVRALEHELRDLAEQSRHSTLVGSFLPREHYRGKIAYIKWLDPHRGQRLSRLYKRVGWRHIEWMMRQRPQ